MHSHDTLLLVVDVDVPPSSPLAAVLPPRPRVVLLSLRPLPRRRHEPARLVVRLALLVPDDVVPALLARVLLERIAGRTLRREPDLLLEEGPDLLEREALGLCAARVGVSG